MQKSDESKNAVIYVRVSTKEQAEEGNSLATQEKDCREYARKHEYRVVGLFRDEGESAKTADRPQLQNMLRFCTNKKNAVSAVIVYKFNRLARNVEDHTTIRALLRQHKIKVLSATEPISDDPVGRFVENMLANVSQFDNDMRSELCANGMKNAVRDGRYVWQAPFGYKNVKISGRATIAQDPLIAPFVRQAFEIMASGVYAVTEVWEIISKKGFKTKSGKRVSRNYFYEILRNELYTGWINQFGERHRGKFDPIVSDALFAQVQRVLNKRGRRTRSYKADREDFPLRRFVVSPFGFKLTGGWSTGKSGTKHPYYNFKKGGCFQRDALDKKFAEHMDSYKFDESKVARLYEYVRNEYGKATQNEKDESTRIERRKTELADEQAAVIRKNAQGVIPDTALTSHLALIDEERMILDAALVALQEVDSNAEEAVMHSEAFLRAPGTFWRMSDFATQKELQSFEFPSGVVLEDKNFRTLELSSLFATKGLSDMSDSALVDPSGFEPLTSTLQMWRSTN